MADCVYASFERDLALKLIDLVNDEVRAILVTSSYTPNKNTHEKMTDITNEVSASGYTQGGQALSGKTVTKGTNRAYFDANDPEWNPSSITARGCVLAVWKGAASGSPLLGYLDFGSDKVSVSDQFKVQFNVDGILQWTV